MLEGTLMNDFNPTVYGLSHLGVSLAILFSAPFYTGIMNFSKNEQTIFKSEEDTSLAMGMPILMIPAMTNGACLTLALSPSTMLSSSPSSLKVSIILLGVLSLLLSIYLNKKLTLISWNKVFWASGLMGSLPLVSPTTPIIVSSLPGISINKLLGRGIFLSAIKLVETKMLKTKQLAHTLNSLQKILSISVL